MRHAMGVGITKGSGLKYSGKWGRLDVSLIRPSHPIAYTISYCVIFRTDIVWLCLLI